MTRVLSKYNYLFLGLFVIIALSFLSINLYDNRVGSASANPGVYASSLDVITQEQLTSVVIADEQIIALTGNHLNLEGVFIHNKAYIGVNEWEQIDLTPRYPEQQDPLFSNAWIRGPADATITKEQIINILNQQGIEETQELYIVMYVCRLYNRLDLTLTEPQRDKLLELFGKDTGYLCGIERFTNNGIINHNKWSLTTINISEFFDEEEPEPLQPIHATCGSNAQEYPYSTTNWPNNNFCNEGTIQGNNPVFPQEGTTTTWTCLGIDGGDNAQCSASRLEEPDLCANRPSLEVVSGGVTKRGDHVTIEQINYQELIEHEMSSVFTNWPRNHIQRYLVFRPNTYASLRFTTPSALSSQHSGAFTFEVVAGTQSWPRIMTISRCEGDFRPQPENPRCALSLEAGDGLHWMGGSQGDLIRCPLESDTEYYLNLIYTTQPIGTPMEELYSDCTYPNNRCGMITLPSSNFNGPVCGPNARTFSSNTNFWPVWYSAPNYEDGFCRGGHQPSPLPSFPASGQTINWVCNALPGQPGSPQSCSASRE